MKRTYVFLLNFPILDSKGSIRFTTRSHLMFRSKIVAEISRLIMRLLCVLKGKPWSVSSLYRMPFFSIDTDLDLMYQDHGPWRSYRLTASGDTESELIADATIEEVDQDGGTLRVYGLEQTTNQISDLAIQEISNTILKTKNKY